jgi:hypothetical protein
MDDRIKRLIEAQRLANPLGEAIKSLSNYRLGQALASLNAYKIPKLSLGIERVLAAQNDRMYGMLRSLQTNYPQNEDLLKRIELGRGALGHIFPEYASRFGNIFKSWDDLPERTRNSILAMAEAGWYLDLQMSFPKVTGFQQVVEEEGSEVADASMTAHFEKRLDAIQAFLIEGFPSRKRFFDAVFDAVRRGEHILAVPVLLAQTDGICKDVAGEYLFITEKGVVPARPSVARFMLEQVHSDLSDAFLCMFEEVRPIGLTEKRRAPGFKGLNRHTVLHGEDLEYGTKLNSLKAVSLLNYVAQILTRKLDDEDELEDLEDECREPDQQS